jgi:acyl-CoA synthetase (NDP forming)
MPGKREVEDILGREKLNQLDLIFHPRSIAVVGVSEDENKIASLWLKSLVSRGFKGELYAVNPKGGEIFGRKIWPSLSSIPGLVDLVIVCTPRSTVLDLLRECADKRVRAVYFYTAGFSESGEQEWVDVEEEMVQVARDGGFQIIGPNCFGVYNPKHGIPYGPFNIMAPIGSVGLVFQSGGNMGKVLEFGMTHGLGFGKGVSLGNASDLGAADFLEYLALDPDTKVIGLYLEGPRDTHRLFEVMRAAAEMKPVVVWKGGSSPAGARAAVSHTGALASSAGVWSGALRQAGAIEVRSLDEMTDTLLLLDRFGRLRRNNLGAICGLTDGGGGESVLISDICAAAGIEVPPLTDGAGRALVELIGQVGSVLGNPVDMSQCQSVPEKVEWAMELVAGEPQIDVLLIYESAGVLLDFYPREVTDAVNEVILGFAQKKVKPVVLVLPHGPAEARRGEIEHRFIGAGVPVFPSIERAAKAIRNMCQYSCSQGHGFRRGMRRDNVAKQSSQGRPWSL